MLPTVNWVGVFFSAAYLVAQVTVNKNWLLGLVSLVFVAFCLYKKITELLVPFALGSFIGFGVPADNADYWLKWFFRFVCFAMAINLLDYFRIRLRKWL